MKNILENAEALKLDCKDLHEEIMHKPESFKMVHDYAFHQITYYRDEKSDHLVIFSPSAVNDYYQEIIKRAPSVYAFIEVLKKEDQKSTASYIYRFL